VIVRGRVLISLLTCVAVLAGCASTPAGPADYKRPPRDLTPPFAGAPNLPPADMTDDGPGSLAEVKPVDTLDALNDADATTVRVIYRSTDDRNGKVTPVSAVIAVPPGPPPREGWPIVSVGHQITGLASFCGPTRAENLAGIAPFLAGLIGRGYIVVMSDYQGLGVDGGPVHSILDSATLANNLIDGVRAARRVAPGSSSDRWAAFGFGQGGLAAWAAAERTTTYGAGLNMVGAVAAAPFADLSDLADAAAGGTLTREQYRLLIMLLQSLADSPAGLDLDHYRFGLAKEKWDLLLNCAPRDAAEVGRIADQLGPDDLRPDSPAATDRLRQALRQVAISSGAATPSAPVLVAFGTSDPLVPASGTERAIHAACTRGEPISIIRSIGDSGTRYQVLEDALGWMRSRFDGVPVDDICVGST
jgi:alpha-beta hydrolase superfamily lysophospholipase